MRTVIVYESLYGNTHEVAARLAEAAQARGEVALVPVSQAGPDLLVGADLVMVGGPTHAHGMSRPSTRSQGVRQAVEHGQPALDPDAEGNGLREWFDTLAPADGVWSVAFDTRMEGSALLTGRASKGIASRLAAHGLRLVAPPESFLVDHQNHLEPGEGDRARSWADTVLHQVMART